MNLHELSRKDLQAWGGKVIQEGKAEGEEALLPMLFELGEDIFDVVLINQGVAFHNRFGGGAVVHVMQDLLLVPPGNLGIGDKEGREQGIRLFAFLTVYTLHTEAYGVGKVFHHSPVMAEKDQTSLLAAGTFNHMHLQAVYQLFI